MWFLFIITAFVIYYLYKNKKRKQVTKAYEDNPEESRLFYSEFIKQNKEAETSSDTLKNKHND
ncbi:MAG TPA: hypothetical protein VGE40_08225 [Bacilli bacterium]